MKKVADKSILLEIENKKYSKKIKNELIDITKNINKIIEYGYDIPNILIYNYNKKELDIFKKELIKILKALTYNVNIIDYNKDSINFSKLSSTKKIIIIDNIDVFYEDEYRFKNKIIRMSKNEELSFIILLENEITEEDDYCEFLDKIYKGFNIKIFDNSLSIDDVYNILIKKLKKRDISINISKDNIKNILNLLYKNQKFINSSYIDKLVHDITLLSIMNRKKTIIKDDLISLYGSLIDKEDSIEYKDKLNKMHGLKEVKNEINNLENYLEFLKKCKTKEKKTYLNLFFLGNSGTGKTTVARIFKDILYKLGYIKKDKIIEIVPNDLTGVHVGETRDVTRKILEKAKDGLLFIDEAYLLYSKSYKSNGQNPYMEEALVELMKYMEDPNNIIIFAGYPNEMREVYNANRGLKSRIYKEIEFKDYTNLELYDILVNYLSNYNLKINKKIKSNILKYLDEVRKDNDFGNARYVEKFGQVLINNHANRKLEVDNYTIDELDIPNFDKNSLKKIGFVGE